MCKLFDFHMYGMNRNVIAYMPIPKPGSDNKPFVIAIDDEDIKSIGRDIELKQIYVTFSAVSSMVTRGVVCASFV